MNDMRVPSTPEVIHVSDTQSLDRFHRAQDAFGALVEVVAADQWTASTPCSAWDVRALVNHLVNEQLWAAPMLKGQTIEDVGDTLEGDLLGADPQGAWRGAATTAGREFDRPGALDGTILSSLGPSPARQYLAEMTFDLIVHRWDLGSALGHPPTLGDAELGFVEGVAAQMAAMQDQLVAAGVFAEPRAVPSDANRQTAVLAALGR